MAQPRLEDHVDFDAVEPRFHDALGASLGPRGPESLFDLVAGLGLPRGASVVDVGCGRGRQAVELGRRFGFDMLGVDPVDRWSADGATAFALGTAEALPVDDGSVDLVFCRESLMYPDLTATTAEFHRVLRTGGRGLVYLVLAGPRLSDADAADITSLLGGRILRPAEIEGALGAAGLRVDEVVDYGSEWGERAQERDGTGGERLLHAARLLREPDRYIAEFGEEHYAIMLGDCLWHVYRLLGKLAGWACTFRKTGLT